jgi:hypothetical protein
MDTTLRTAIRQQFEAAIQMLENAMRACPDQLWHVRLWGEHALQPELSEFWYIVYHSLFWLDLYLSGSVDGFVPPAPFTLDELDPSGVLPEKPYTKDELQAYLDHDRLKCLATIEGLTDEMARQPCKFSWGEVTFVELLLDNMRHIQEHTAQLNLILGQKTGWNPGWIARVKSTTA